MANSVWSIPCCPNLQLLVLPLSPQEMIALGCSNFFGSFFKIHVICCALSVTLAVDGAGGKSQVSSVPGELGRGGRIAEQLPQRSPGTCKLLLQTAPVPRARSTKGSHWK